MTALLLLDLPTPTVISVFLITHLKYINCNCDAIMVNSFVRGGDYLVLYTKKLNMYK